MGPASGASRRGPRWFAVASRPSWCSGSGRVSPRRRQHLAPGATRTFAGVVADRRFALVVVAACARRSPAAAARCGASSAALQLRLRRRSAATWPAHGGAGRTGHVCPARLVFIADLAHRLGASGRCPRGSVSSCSARLTSPSSPAYAVARGRALRAVAHVHILHAYLRVSSHSRARHRGVASRCTLPWRL